MTQILLNILSNALKFTFKGFIEVTADCFSKENEKFIRINVLDSGIGIKEEDIPKLFTCFGMLDDSAKINQQGESFEDFLSFSGTGLGLSTCAKIIKLLGGDITVKSKFGQGTCFSFWFKDSHHNSEELVEIEKSEIPDSSKDCIEELKMEELGQSNSVFFCDHALTENNVFFSSPVVKTDLQQDVKILIVDDNDFNIFSFQCLLKEYGVSSDVAHHGKEAIEKVLKNRYNIIFMDCLMPIMDGFQVTEQKLKINLIGINQNQRACK